MQPYAQVLGIASVEMLRENLKNPRARACDRFELQHHPRATAKTDADIGKVETCRP
jgi:hypothetical protein